MIESQLAEVIERQIRLAVDQSMENYVEKIITQLVLDPAWVAKIETQINHAFARRIAEEVSMLDMKVALADTVRDVTDSIKLKIAEDLRTPGVIDRSNKTEITVMDDVVVIENQLAARSVLVDKDAEVQGTLIVNNLALRGSVNVENPSWNELTDKIAQDALTKMTDAWIQQLVRQVLDLASTSSIDFADVSVAGRPIIEGDTLNANITKSSLQKIGVLDDIRVTGKASFNDTMTVNRQRVGINTDEPEMALSVWDEEVSVVAGKLAKQQAFVGTSRLTNLALGINRTPQIEMDVDGLTTIKQLRVGQHRIGHARDVPGHSGTRGDIMFNSDPKPGTPFGWVCLGSFKWQPLKSV